MAGEAHEVDIDPDMPDADEAEQGQEGAQQAAGDDETGAEGQDSDGAGEGAEAGEQAANDDAELVVTLGDEDPGAQAEQDQTRAPDWVRDLRRANREKDRRIRELEAAIQAPRQQAQQPLPVGERPKLADFDFDEDRHADALAAWATRKAQAEQQQRQRELEAQQEQQRWQARLNAVNNAGASLKVSGHEEAQEAFEDTFSIMQQAMVLNGFDDPKDSALMRIALGKNPAKAKQLAAIADPVKFAIAIGELRTKMKATPKKTAPAPDQPVRSPGAGAGVVAQGRLNQLHAEAQRTGDYTKYLAAKRAARKAA